MASLNLTRLGGISGILFVLALSSGIFIARPDLLRRLRFDFPGGAPLLWRQPIPVRDRQRSGLCLRRLLFSLVLRSASQRAAKRGGRGGRVLVRRAFGGRAVHSAGVSGGGGRGGLPGKPGSFRELPTGWPEAFHSLQLSGWLYNFAWVGLAVLIAAASVLALGTENLPRWLTWTGFLFVLVALLKFLTPPATLALVWVLLVSVLKF